MRSIPSWPVDSTTQAMFDDQLVDPGVSESEDS